MEFDKNGQPLCGITVLTRHFKQSGEAMDVYMRRHDVGKEVEEAGGLRDVMWQTVQAYDEWKQAQEAQDELARKRHRKA